jgi:hypothetical protein
MAQQHEELLLPKAALINAWAQPTPLWTTIASVGQLVAHAPHSMQASRSAISALPLSIRNTL